jgi:hypothetical protein
MKLNERIEGFAKLGDWLDDSDVRTKLANTAGIKKQLVYSRKYRTGTEVDPEMVDPCRT